VIERADILFGLGRGSEAVKGYQALVARGSNLPGLRARLGDLHNALGERGQAVASYREQLKITPADRYTRNQLAATLALRGGASDLSEALALTDALMSERAAKVERDNVLDTRATILVALGRSADALAIYEDLANRDALHDTESWHRYGRLVLGANDRARALRIIERALDSGSSYPARDEDIRFLSTG
jgi:tetratricopeptide (TPR) repeat protein